jgi:putative ABC transport system permease protein
MPSSRSENRPPVVSGKMTPSDPCPWPLAPPFAMSSLRLILASLIHYGRINLAVACGVAAGTAVLTGALLVGDSMRGSLRDLTLDGLGRIEHALVTEQFFRAELADELAADPQFQEHFTEAVPAILLEASIKWQPDGSSEPVRVGGVNVIACDERFWALGSGGPEKPPQSRKLVVLNRPLAERLGIDVGPAGTGAPEKPTRVMLHLPNLGTIPSGALLGQKTETVKGHDLTLSEVIPAEGLGRFSLRPNQQLPLNAYVSLELGKWLFRREVERRGERVNAILVAGRDDRSETETGSEQVLENLLRPKLVDYGIDVEQTPRGYFNVTTERMLLDPVADELMFEALAEDDVQPALTYLANTIALGEREIPYSTITAVDFTDKEPLGPFLSPQGEPIGPLEEGQIVLNDWAAEDLGARPGDTIRVTYFEPESPHAAMQETTEPFELAAIAALSGAADDEHFTPSVPGVTDKDSMADWEAPFQPFDPNRIRSPDQPGPGNDEDYWDHHGTTPKAFVSLATGRRLWGSRFGRTTSLRVPPAERRSVESIERKLEKKLAPHAAALGFVFQPVKRQGLDASVGATSFSQLFIAFSFFIIAAAVMLVALLFRLGIDGRANQVGILLAVGFSRRKVARLLAAEGLLIAALGSAFGVAVGIAYAGLMLVGLTSWWLPAIGTPFLRFHAATGSMLAGYLCGVLAALVAIVWAVWRTRGTAARQLLAGQIGKQTSWTGRPRFARLLAWIMLAGAIVLGLLAAALGEQMQAGVFFGAGAMVLVASLALTWTRLRTGAVGTAVAVGRGNLTRMAVRNLARNPARSTLTIGLVASASFLIVSVSAFHLDPRDQTPNRESGNGGFALVAESDQPIYHDLNTKQGREELGFSPDDSRLFEGAKAYSLRGKPGEDASCLNLYKPREPRLLGVPREMVQRGGFVFKRWMRISHKMEAVNPWLVLDRDLGRDGDGVPLVPAVVDAATATYALHLSKRHPTLDIRTDRGETIRLQVVGVLPGSIFQGDLLVPEEALLRHFPDTSGYRFFLVEAEPEKTEPVRKALDNALGDYGLQTETTGQRLVRFLIVQNTYLGTFQSLGGLGLLLGTFGLAAVQLRNVLERRGELALLRATGFGRRALAWLVMIENGLLLGAGLACGVLAALVAVLPHLVSGGASVPWGSLTATLLLVLGVGLIASLGAVRAVLTAPLLSALRGE